MRQSRQNKFGTIIKVHSDSDCCNICAYKNDNIENEACTDCVAMLNLDECYLNKEGISF